MSSAVRLRRVYDDPSPSDGTRVLVDRLWPRGIPKQAAQVDQWLKDVAPSHELRTWYGHAPERFEEFRRRYLAELDGDQARRSALEVLRGLRGEPLTLVTATKDVPHSHAAVLAQVLGEED